MLNVKLDPNKVYKAISEGVENAIWQMITNATNAPCSDFYYAIEKAAREAFEKVGKRSFDKASSLKAKSPEKEGGA
jgi:hypothetical protein